MSILSIMNVQEWGYAIAIGNPQYEVWLTNEGFPAVYDTQEEALDSLNASVVPLGSAYAVSRVKVSCFGTVNCITVRIERA